MSLLKPGSSPIDWCENNYVVLSSVAEFANTISNVFFLILPLISLFLFRPYGEYIDHRINIVWVLFLVVGLSSAYFHATLSLLGQLLDELSILWVVATGFALWFPRRLQPIKLRGNRQLFQKLVFVAACLSTLLCCIKPAINAFALLSLMVRLGQRCTLVLVAAVTCWLTDRFACDWSWRWGLPYLHALWHILICLGTYSSCVLLAYFEAVNEAPEQTPVLRFWPSNDWQILGIPYVFLRTAHKIPSIPAGAHNLYR